MKSSRIALQLLVILGLIFAFIETRFIKRDVEQKSTCTRSMPCGWEIYTRYSRASTEFVDSPCACSETTRCVRAYDDISLSAYVFRCLPLGEEANEWNTVMESDES